MVDLPLNGRNAAALTTLVAGAVPAPADGAGAFVSRHRCRLRERFPSEPDELPARRRQQQRHLTNVNLPFPFPDALQEFSVQTNTTGAVRPATRRRGQHRHQVAAPTKSMATRSSSFATPFSTRGTSSPSARPAQAQPVRRHHRRSRGHSELYNGRDKTFFFFRLSGDAPSQYAERRLHVRADAGEAEGDFSALLPASESRQSSAPRGPTQGSRHRTAPRAIFSRILVRSRGL